VLLLVLVLVLLVLAVLLLCARHPVKVAERGVCRSESECCCGLAGWLAGAIIQNSNARAAAMRTEALLPASRASGQVLPLLLRARPLDINPSSILLGAAAALMRL